MGQWIVLQSACSRKKIEKLHRLANEWITRKFTGRSKSSQTNSHSGRVVAPYTKLIIAFYTLFRDKNFCDLYCSRLDCLKTIPWTAAHIHIVNIWDYPSWINLSTVRRCSVDRHSTKFFELSPLPFQTFHISVALAVLLSVAVWNICENRQGPVSPTHPPEDWVRQKTLHLVSLAVAAVCF